MQNNSIKNFLNQKLSIMVNALESDKRYKSIDPNLIEELSYIIYFQIGKRSKNISIKIESLYNQVKRKCFKGEIEFDDYTFCLSLVQVLKEFIELYRLSYFKDMGWVVLKIKGRCFNGFDGSCLM